MAKTKMLLMGALLTVASSTFAAPQGAAPTGIDSYEIKEFVADFTQFKIGDRVPAMYLTDEYNITKWQLRNLPAPEAGSRWTYMGGNYVQITDAEGKILKAYNGDIFYHR
ncbi:RcnB family protein [Siccibacter colletis]|jgi:Ni/Co efflux regulator RcnB|nr:RcnB family protein [Siccibacter colletis]WNN47345.1 RcnB family protein [Siccibacter colletis]